MGSHEIAETLTELAEEAPEVIVEVGAWLGAGTWYLAESGKEVHVFDRWQASVEETEKARRQGVKIEPGQDLMPLHEKFVPHPNVVRYKMHLSSVVWGDLPIGLYVDDAAKSRELFERVMRVFSPHFIPGAKLVLMDYYFYEKRPDYVHQKHYMASDDRFEFLYRAGPAAIFRCLRS